MVLMRNGHRFFNNNDTARVVSEPSQATNVDRSLACEDSQKSVAIKCNRTHKSTERTHKTGLQINSIEKTFVQSHTDNERSDVR